MAQVAHESYALQEHLGENNCRTNVQVNAASIHLTHDRSKQSKVCVGCCAQRSTIDVWMKMRDVPAYRDM